MDPAACDHGVVASEPAPPPTVPIRDEVIRLGQFLKLAGLADSGADARELIEDEAVLVDGVVEDRRGRQLRRGAVVVVLLPGGPESAVVG